MADIHALKLPDHIREEGIGPAYALVGEEDYLVRGCIHELRDAVETPDAPGSMTRQFEGDAEPGEVMGELRTAPFMGMQGRRLVIVRGADRFSSAHGEQLTKYLRRPSRTSVLVLCFGRLDGRTAVAKALKQTGLIVDCSPLSWRRAESWVRSEASSRGKKLTPRAAEALMEAVGTNMFQLENELAKLLEYTDDAPAISEQDVEEVVPRSRTRSIFAIGDAVARGDAAGAFDLAYRLLLRGESVHGIVSILGRRVRQLWQIKRLREETTDAGQIAGRLGVPPFVVRKSMKLLPRLTDRFLARQVHLLAAADHELKTTALGAGEEEAWLVQLVARLCRDAE